MPSTMSLRETLAVFAGLAGLWIIIGIVLAWYVLQVIALWKIFTKMGEAGWKSLIPIYNLYILFRRTWQTKFFWIFLILSAISGMFSSLYASNSALMIMGILEEAAMIAAIVISVIFTHKISKSFGRGAGFTLGLIFLEPIFLMILGFGQARYVGGQTKKSAN